jgi:hypothetical protein
MASPAMKKGRLFLNGLGKARAMMKGFLVKGKEVPFTTCEQPWEVENARLKKLVADLSLDNAVLKEASRETFKPI